MDSLHFKGKGFKSLNTLVKTQTHFIIILLYIYYENDQRI